jgi:hypothetical protein
MSANDSLFEKSEISVVYATYKQGLWDLDYQIGLDNPRPYINLMYYLQEHGGEYLDGEDASRIVSQVKTIAEYAREGEIRDAFREMQSLMGNVERTCPSMLEAMKDGRRSYAKHMRMVFGTRWKQRVNGAGYSGADYSTYSGNEFVDMLGLGPEDFGY